MVEASDGVVLTALAAVLRDHGWPSAAAARRLRAALNDVLGAQADDHRAAVDALVVSVEEGVVDEIRRGGRPGAAEGRSALVRRLHEWGLSTERAEWAVDAWTAQLVASTMPPPEQPDTAEAPTSLPAAAEPTALPPAPAIDLAPTELPASPSPSASQPPSGPAASRPQRRDRRALAVGALALVLVAGGGVAAALSLDSDETDPSTTAEPRQPETSAPTEQVARPARDGAVVPVTEVLELPAAQGRLTMAARTGGVRIARVGELDQVETAEQTRTAPEGGRLVGFRLTNWPCEAESCTPWSRLGLAVQVGDDVRRLPKADTTDTFAVAVPAGVSDAQLVMQADGHRQTLSLLTGEPGRDNIAVLEMPKKWRSVRLDERFDVVEQYSQVVNFGGVQADRVTRSVRVRGAELTYFTEHGSPQNPRRAYLKVRADYTLSVETLPDTYAFQVHEVSFRSGGTTYRARDIDPGEAVNAVFEVPADTRSGVFHIGSRRREPGQPYTVTISPRDVRIRLR